MTKHLETINDAFQKTINNIVEELTKILEEIDELDKDISPEDIILQDDCTIWKKVILYASRYSKLFGDHRVVKQEDIIKECIEVAIAQYKKERQVSKVIEKMRSEALDFPIINTNSAVEVAVEKLLDIWILGLEQEFIKEDYDFRFDAEITTRSISSWVDSAVPIVQRTIKEIQSLQQD